MEEIKEMLKSIMKVAINNSKKEEEKGADVEVANEKTDKRKLIDEIGGILKGKVDEELWRTVIGKAEKLAYEKSEAGTADNEKEEKEDEEKVEELEEDLNEDVQNKCKKVKNSKPDYFEELNKIYNSTSTKKEVKSYVTRQERLEDGKRF